MDDKLYEAARLRGSDIPSYDNIEDAELLLRLTPGDESNVFHVAARHGNSSFITAVLGRAPSLRYELLCKHNSKRHTPLHLAAQSGDRDTVQALLDAHDVDMLPPFGNQKRPCWSERDNQGDTPLHCALKYGHEDIALLLHQSDQQSVSLRNNAGESPAYLAADNSCAGILQTILDSQCRVSFSGPFGETAFHPLRKLTQGIMSTAIERKRGLLKVQDMKGKTVLHYAIEENRESIVKILLKADNSLAWLLDSDGFTPLHKAASMGLFSMVETILDLSPQCLRICEKSHGRTALHVAKMEAGFLAGCLKRTRMKELINEVDNDGNSPLHIALINSDLQIIEVLLEVIDINWSLRNK